MSGTVYRVSETFGPTIQGEGAQAGRPTMFVRLGGCDYRCVWCDSLHAVDPIHKATWRPMTADAILAALAPMPPGILLTLSGGNPALYDGTDFVRAAHTAGHPVTMETQGSIAKPWFALLDHLCLSPKPPSAGQTTSLADVANALQVGPRDTILKMVVFDDRDLDYAATIHDTFPSVPCYLQPGNATVTGALDVVTALATYQALIARVLARPGLQDVRVLPQLHTLLWGNARAV